MVPPTPTATPKVKRGGTVRTSIITAYDTLDNKLTSVGATPMNLLLFQALFRYDLVDPVGKFEVKPELAESWQVVDPKTIEIKLRKGLKFQDGSDFNADVVKHNFDRMMTDPKSQCKFLVDDVSSLQVIDRYTVRLLLKYPSAPLLVKLSVAWGGTGSAGAGMMSKAAYEKWGSEVGASPRLACYIDRAGQRLAIKRQSVNGRSICASIGNGKKLEVLVIEIVYSDISIKSGQIIKRG